MKNPTQTLLVTAVLATALAGCQSTGGYQTSSGSNYPPSSGNYPPPQGETEEQRLSRTQRGALIGAAVGAVAGLLSGSDATERRQRALVGAGVGGLTGGAIGRYQDNQERDLRQRMAGTGVDVVRQGDNITLDMPEAITFGFDSAVLRAGSNGVLDRVADTLVQYEQTIIEVAGHTDSVGTDAYNQRLSEQRATAVGNYLTARGVNRERLILTGAGEAYPVASNDTDAGRAQNRRVEITLVPLRN